MKTPFQFARCLPQSQSGFARVARGGIFLRRRFFVLGLLALALAGARGADDLGAWTPQPADAKGIVVNGATATIASEKWAALHSAKVLPNVEVSATVVLHEAAKGTRFFGQGWSAWPDRTFSDDGFEEIGRAHV